MPVTDQNAQLAALMQMLMKGPPQGLQNPGMQLPSSPGGSAIGNMLGGAPSTPGMTQLSPTAGLPAPSQGAAPPTLGMGRGMPMQMPPLQSANPDPQGAQDKPPPDPYPPGG